MPGDQARALQDPLEVALREPLALGDHAEAVRAGRLGRPSVLEDLLGRHHGVHGRIRLGEPRLCAEPAVLRAPTRLGVHEGAHVGGVAEAVEPRPESPVDKRLDLGVVLDLAEGERFLVGDQGGHRRGQGKAAAGRLREPQRAFQRGGRFSAHERIPSRKSSE